jgi:hypothetical protein
LKRFSIVSSHDPRREPAIVFPIEPPSGETAETLWSRFVNDQRLLNSGPVQPRYRLTGPARGLRLPSVLEDGLLDYLPGGTGANCHVWVATAMERHRLGNRRSEIGNTYYDGRQINPLPVNSGMHHHWLRFPAPGFDHIIDPRYFQPRPVPARSDVARGRAR